MKFKTILLISLFTSLIVSCDRRDTKFVIGSNFVQEGDYQAEVLSPTQMISNYPMDIDTSIPQPILFKLSLNGSDNEAGFGKDHYLVIPEGVTEFYAPLLKFGSQTPPPPAGYVNISWPVNVHFRVDMRPILDAFESTSYFVTSTNDTIYENTFEGLYIAGGVSPLEWIWDKDHAPQGLRFEDADQDSIYDLTLKFAPSPLDDQSRQWDLSQDISNLPKFSSPEAPLLEALTNLALEEALLNIRSDGAFSAGKEWQGVWTRDVSYAAQLSLAYLFPETVKTSLRAKLSESGRIIQDTGTGGAWPISSDRHIWTLAAWEVYLATGDEEWLAEIKKPIINALQEDLLWNRDPVSGMLMGETSFEDWREQTYPEWMTPANIHASHALSTNIIFKRALEIGLALEDKNQGIIRTWPRLIERLDQNILNHFWDSSLNAPTSYVMTNPGWEAANHRDLLGESLGILYMKSFAEVDSQLVATYPRTPFGTPVISNQLPHAPAYHNKAIWPFVETYGLLAAKKAGNSQAFAHGFNSLIRSAALFLSHRENFHYSSGRPDATQINSDRQLWSVAGWLGAIYKGLFGISINYDFDQNGFNLLLEPNNPFDWGQFSISDLRLHNTDISILLKGSGDAITSILINGEQHKIGQPIPLEGGSLDIVVELNENKNAPTGNIVVANNVLPDSPEIIWSNDSLAWASESALTILELNGQIIDTLNQQTVVISDSLNGFFSLRSIDSTGQMSLPTKPHYLGPSATLMLSSQEPYYIELGKDNTYIDMNFSVPSAGNYLVRFIYSNGSGPINTGNTCGLAKLVINDWWLEQMVSFPHTGSWENLSTTSWLKAQFNAGVNTLKLNQESLPVTNMNGEKNLFRVLSIEIVPL